MTSSSSLTDIKTLLANLRDTPVDSHGTTEELLGTVWSHLMSASAKPPDNVLHWFCDQVEPDIRESAIFLLRLHAYDADKSPQVHQWNGMLKACTGACIKCVQALEGAKVEARHTYFGAFREDVVKSFFQSFEQWELRLVLEDLSRVGLLGQPQTNATTLSDVNPAIVYRMVSNWTIFNDPRILSVIYTYPPSQPITGWPSDPLPPGMHVLLMDDNPKVRLWAESHAHKCTIVPMQAKSYIGPYPKAIEIIGNAMSLTAVSTNSSNGHLPFSFARNLPDLWTGFLKVLRLTPVEVLKSSPSLHVDLCRIITGHVHDTGTHFYDILRCLILLLKRMDNKFWVGEGPEFPQVIFDSIKDNPALSELIVKDSNRAAEIPWLLTWFQEYLHTIRDSPVYGDVLAKMVDLLCEEMQHERYKETRPLTMNSALRLLLSVLKKSYKDDTFRHRQALDSTLDVHSGILLGVAFSHSFDDEKWKDARSAAHILVTKILQRDSRHITNVIMDLCDLLSRVPQGSSSIQEFPSPSLRKQMWKDLYASVQTNDANGIATLINIVAQTAHIDFLNLKPFAPAFIIPNAENALNDVNRGLAMIREGFLSTMTKFASHSLSSSALDVLRQPNVVKHVTVLMLSPVDDVQQAAQILVGLAFDVDARQECFRALLTNLPGAALEGIFEFLNIFIGFAPRLPEACNLSKSLVRCFTDVIEVLCMTPDGLLHSPRFLQPENDKGPAAMLPKLWNLMTKSLTVVFKRTPPWSVYFETADMVVWMRDALIFGRDMLGKWRVVETAANSRPSADVQKPGKLSSLGKKMLEPLQDVLLELTRWLRLTDEELLHQSFSLLTSLLDCFLKFNIPLRPENVSKLRKYIEGARKSVPNVPRTRLDQGRLVLLEVALDNFEDSNKPIDVDEVQAKLPSKTLSIAVSHAGPSRTVLKPQQLAPTRFLSSKRPKTSRHTRHIFTDKDQEKLDAAIPAPSFRRSDIIPAKPSVLAPPKKQPDPGPKNESAIQTPSSPGTSESDDDDDEEEETKGGLAALSKIQRSPKIRRAPERRQIKTLDLPPQVHPADAMRLKRRQEARAAAARLKPDISSLHKHLLSWDFEHSGSEPPGAKLELARVPDSFADYTEYKKVFRPLLLLECWAQILHAKEQRQDVYECQINSRQFTDSWLDADISITGPSRKDWFLTENDVVLLRHPITKKCIMAKTQSYKQTPHQGTQASLRCYLKEGTADPGLQIGAKWQLSKVFSLSTLHRECAALESVEYYDFADTILRPRLSQVSRPDKSEIQEAMITYSVNEPQATAILSSLQTEGFVLIQGPPGTGKTSTICGLVAASLSKRSRPPVVLHVGRRAAPVDQGPLPKILVCAPSNAAIDEIASRIHAGFRGSEKKPGSVNVVRLGNKASMNNSVYDISLDALVEKKLDPHHSQSKDVASTEIAAKSSELESLKQSIAQKQAEKAATHNNTARIQALDEEISQLNARRAQKGRELNQLRDKDRAESRNLDALRRKTRVEVVREADVVCTTLSGAGHEILEQFDFEMVIIDEAAQAIELSSLIPLKYRFNRCVMVGDPQQLAPTVISPVASRFLYDKSLFVRLQKQRPESVHLLSIQYRMHPEISRVPSRIFYQGRLQDGPRMDIKTEQPWHKSLKFGTYRFFNVFRGLEESSGTSTKNQGECEVAVALYGRLRQEFSSTNLDYRVGVISMYKAQIMELKRQFAARFGQDILETVDFNTVDGFQGQEKDVIILSCVRAGPGIQSVGFLKDDRRMNVALTRAKSSLFILGNAPTLERSDPTWRDIVQDARSRSSLVDADPTYFTRPHSAPSISTSPSKSSKVVPSLPIPTDLVTPRDFKATVHQGAGRPSQSTVPPGPRGLNPFTTQLTDVLPIIPLKRSAECDAAPLPPPPDNFQPDGPKMPRMPSIKRPKQPKQTSMFIPKPKKRPADDNIGGPSNRKKS